MHLLVHGGVTLALVLAQIKVDLLGVGLEALAVLQIVEMKLLLLVHGHVGLVLKVGEVELLLLGNFSLPLEV